MYRVKKEPMEKVKLISYYILESDREGTFRIEIEQTEESIAAYFQKQGDSRMYLVKAASYWDIEDPEAFVNEIVISAEDYAEMVNGQIQDEE